MSIFDFKFDLSNIDILENNIKNIFNNLNFNEAFDKIANDFWNEEEAIFKNEGDYGGRTKWKDLSTTPLDELGGLSYKEWKDINYPGLPILTLTGDLRSSLTGNNNHSIFNKTNLSMEIGTDIEYGIYHQKGAMNIPRRRFLNTTENQKDRWTRIINNVLSKQINGEK